MIVLSGGTGTPKLIQGFSNTEMSDEIKVIVNTAEDKWVSSNLVCPDVDTILYLLSNKLDTSKWWGIKNDTFKTYHQLQELGYEEDMMIGDMDRSTHIIRTSLLSEGKSLSESINSLRILFDISTEVYPMSDDPISTYVNTDKGTLHYQDFWIKEKGLPEVSDVWIEGINEAKISPMALKALHNDDRVLIGPSNPVTSIGPILALKEMRDILEEKTVLAVSPIISKKAFSGPAVNLMKAKNIEISSSGVASEYKELIDGFIVDVRDDCPLSSFKGDYKVYREDTLMTSLNASKNLARSIINIFDNLS
ncbi:2-phospho-L-lactate transferase [Methanosalsum natronophilum]|uniref:2-phospho-L-lactate transferase n=1 Tax=Methanosalsum natronophilum TaxID=768733 RepID=A0A3R7X7C1_9EURY|nr:2-phospho-L-lactate transferase [Methanosalsum natronophilum]MCS3923533.1 LPPG:FO 2-phospho-L-lactate transferase [Methanosalsum natronophilum]RQD87879.1 MAG: 2-phospho-L-lactate transferase [Methanosalsum natronophilum]